MAEKFIDSGISFRLDNVAIYSREAYVGVTVFIDGEPVTLTSRQIYYIVDAVRERIEKEAIKMVLAEASGWEETKATYHSETQQVYVQKLDS